MPKFLMGKRRKYFIIILGLLIVGVLIRTYNSNNKDFDKKNFQTNKQPLVPEEYNKDFCVKNCKVFLDDDWSRENNPESDLEKCYIGNLYPSGVISPESIELFNESICKNHCNICAGLTCTTQPLDKPKSCKQECSQETNECSRINCGKDFYGYILYTCEYIDGTSFEKEFEYPELN